MLNSPAIKQKLEPKSEYKMGLNVEDDLQELLKSCRKHLKQFNEELITKSFRFCVAAHDNQLRKSGRPYYLHPLSVAYILIEEITLDDVALAAALLHDVPTYSPTYTIKDIKKEFGSKITHIVESIAKIGHIERHSVTSKKNKSVRAIGVETPIEDDVLKEENDLDDFDAHENEGQIIQIENYYKLLLSMFTDVRIILIQLADRLHNMRTLQYLSPAKQKEYSKETLDIYCPITNRVGLGNFKWELEDLAFKYLSPDIYQSISKSITGTRIEREQFIKEFTQPIQDRLSSDEFLKEKSISFDINGRPKHIYSIASKLKYRGLKLEELNDIFAVRIILDTSDRNLCFYVYGIVCELYTPLPGTFKNYIHLPKKNGYQSIHTAVIGPDNKNVEVQIRTSKMHEYAEQGLAAHFRYKGRHLVVEEVFEDKNIKDWMDSVKELFDNSSEETPSQLIESVKRNLFHEEIYVFTPKKDLIKLPKDSTPLDFAYAIHTEIGNHYIGAKINGRVVPIDYKLQNGDMIEILRSKNLTPTKEWLKIVITSRAKTAITKYIKDTQREKVISGKSLWEEKLKGLGLSVSSDELKELVKIIKYKSVHDFYINLYENSSNIDRTIEFFRYKFRDFSENNQNYPGSHSREHRPKKESSNKLSVLFAKCCRPVPNDKIVGLRNVGGDIIVHRKSCSELSSQFDTTGMNFFELEWSGIKTTGLQTVLIITAEDHDEVIGLVTSQLAGSEDVLIRGLSYSTLEGVMTIKLTLSFNSISSLTKIKDIVKKLPGIREIKRFE